MNQLIEFNYKLKEYIKKKFYLNELNQYFADK